MAVSAGSGPRDYDFLFKLLIIGDSGVGKSAILVRFADDTFTTNYVTTIGVDFKIRTVTVKNHRIKLQVWDTAGQERFRTITSTYYRNTNAVILVFDVTNGETFSNVKRWLQEVDTYCDGVHKVLVGNKADADLASRVVQKEDAEALADTLRIPYFETSAKENINIYEMFMFMTERVLDSKLAAAAANNKNGSNTIKLSRKTGSGKKKCCF